MANEEIILKARLILEQKGKILLLKQTSRNGGKYSLVGGTVENQELAIQALIRESKEEAGINLDRDSLVLVHTLHKKKGTRSRIVLYFKASKWGGTIQSLEPKKFKKVAWHDLKNLPKNMSPTVKHVLNKYRKGIVYSEFTKQEKQVPIISK